MHYTKIIVILTCIISIYGCTTPFKIIDDPNIPLEGENYFVQPPRNGEWYVKKTNIDGKTTYIFGKKNEPKTLTTYAIITEKYGTVDFNSDKEFVNFVKNSVNSSNDPRRLEKLESKFEIVEHFNSKAVSFYCSYKDKNAANKNDNEFLIIKTAGNMIIHPQDSHIMIQMDYSERGLKSDMDKRFTENANYFFDTIIMKNI